MPIALHPAAWDQSMIASVFVRLDALSTAANGKVDRRKTGRKFDV